MICYRDMTFCNAPCANTECSYRFTNEIVDAARVWWGEPGAPIAVGNRSAGCIGFKPKEENDAKE